MPYTLTSKKELDEIVSKEIGSRKQARFVASYDVQKHMISFVIRIVDQAVKGGVK